MRRLLVVALMTATLVVCPAWATTIHVPADQPTIQAGLAIAAPGDTVLVAPGTYVGSGNRELDFAGKGIVLASESGAGNTTIDCELSGRAFYFHSGEDTTAVVRGFTVINGSAESGGALHCSASSSPIIEDCVMSACEATGVEMFKGGGAVRCDDSSPTLRRVRIAGNSGTRGGGMCCRRANPLLVDVEFYGNSATVGGGLYCRDYSSPELRTCLFVECEATGSGGAVFCDDVSPTFTGCAFIRNSAEDDGGAILNWKGNIVFADCVFASNSALRGGALMYRDSPLPLLSQSTLYGNSAETGGGVLSENSSPQISNAIIAFGGEGAAMVCEEGGEPSVAHCCVYGNAISDSLCGSYGSNLFSDPAFCDAWAGDYSVHASSPCLPMNNPWGELIGALGQGCGAPEGIFVSPDGTGDAPTLQAAIDSCLPGGTVVARQGVFSGDGNQDLDFHGKPISVISEYGAASTRIDCLGSGRGVLFQSGEDTLSVLRGFTISGAVADTGAGILCDGASPSIEDCIISSCSASSGAGIACVRGASPRINGASVRGNIAGFGAGFYCQSGSAPRVSNSVISSNWSGEGAGIWVSGSSPVFADVVVDSNTAAHGAGVYCTVNGNASLRSCGILSNTSSGKGGGVYCSSSSPLLENVTFFANSAGEGGGGVYSLNSSPILRGALVAFSESGEGVLCAGAPQPLLEYSDVFGNAGGDSLCGLDLGGNISEDPLFCDIWDGDFTLCANSPCLVAGAPSGRMGRHGEGCSNCSSTGLEDGPGQSESWSSPWISATPSPFSGRTSISYQPPQASNWITLSIYSVSGRKVTTLVDAPAASAPRTIHWDGRDSGGHSVASGVYLCKLDAGGQTLQKKITLVR